VCGYWFSGEVKEPDMLLECEVANSTWCEVYTAAQSLKKFLKIIQKIKLNTIHMTCVKICVYYSKKSAYKYLNCITGNILSYMFLIHRTAIFRGIYVHTNYSFVHVKHTDLKTKY
jgi:hypothetical protein